MNPLNPSHNPFEEKIQKEYAFEDTNSMSNFVHRISRNPGIKSVDLKGRHAINVNFMNQNAMSSTDSLYNESYQPIEEFKGKVDVNWREREQAKYDAKYGAGKAGDDTAANRASRKKKMDKIASDERDVKARKQKEIERARDAESTRKGEEATKKKREEERKRREQEKKLSDSKSWTDNKLPDLSAAFEEVQKKSLSESVKLSEMDPKKHVKKDEKTGMYCVYNKDGKKVKEFKSQEDANKYATDNHDSLMEYGSPMKPGKKPRTANEPLVKTGQGSYEKNIRPSDILKKKKKR